MDFLSIAKTVGAGLFSTLVPGGAQILGVVNEMLPEDQKLPKSATGNDIANSVEKLSPELKAKVALRKFDVDIEKIKQSYESNRAMILATATNPQSTRPKIALGAFRILALVTFMAVAIFGYAVIVGDDTMVTAVLSGWPFIATITGTFTTLLLAYFGVLKKENENMLNASNGHEAGVSSLGKLIEKVVQK